MIDLLNTAIAIAADGHNGQKDKAEAPYILHPIRVMLKGKTEEEMIVGVLHDLIEDTKYSIWTVRNIFGDRITDAVVALTRKDKEAYAEFIDRVKLNPLATAVKLNDIADNLDPARAGGLNGKLSDRYTRALRLLTGGTE